MTKLTEITLPEKIVDTNGGIRMTDEIKVAEEIVLFLLGVDDKPLNGDIHLQKELFLLSKANPKIQSLFNFKKHIFGPYSQLLADIIENPLYYDNVFSFQKNKISLTPNGVEKYQAVKREHKSQKKIQELENALYLIRSIYDKLSVNEFLLLIYATYPEYLEKSEKYDELFKNKENKKRIVSGLFSKGVVTENRAKELLKV